MAVKKASKTRTIRKALTKKTASKSTAVKKSAAAKTTAPKKTAKKAASRKTSAKKTITTKQNTAKKAVAKTSTSKSSSRKYSPAAGEQVGQELHEMHRGQLRIGRSNKRVTNPKQAIAIGLAEARRAGKKVPPNPNQPRKK